MTKNHQRTKTRRRNPEFTSHIVSREIERNSEEAGNLLFPLARLIQLIIHSQTLS